MSAHRRPRRCLTEKQWAGLLLTGWSLFLLAVFFG